jgi:aminoglycoside phosphotransferase (APT) family kinase protein
MTDILGGNRFINAEPIEKGWSEDKKYCVTNADGKKYLLRISPTPRYEMRKALFVMLEQVAALEIPMCLPIEFGLRFNGDEQVLAYIEQNRHLLKNRPQCFQHGDYHVGNMMIENGELKIIDFDRYDFGDPWEEFNRIVWSAAASPHFATGQLRGYFGGEPPIEFFKLLAFYIASNTLSSIYWASPFGQSDLDTMMKQAQDVLRWYDNMRNPVPAWYLKDFYIQWIDGVPYKLKEWRANYNG